MKQLFTIIFIFVAYFAQAQNATIRGAIMDNGEGLIGATAFIKSIQIGADTDIDGAFELTNVPAGSHWIMFSYIGYDSDSMLVDVNAGENKNLGVIRLKASSEILEGVVVKERLEEGGEVATRLKMLKTDRIANIVGEQSIERLPDKNAGEALARMAGVVLSKDQGEGQYVSFRGTPVDWSSTLVNGDRMPVANEEMVGRSLNFDVVPTSLIAYIENSISLTPDFEGDAIGGTANLITKETPFDSIKFEAQLGFGYNQKAEKPIWNGALSYGDRFFNKRLGVLVGGSIFQRNWSTDNYEIFYGNNDNHSIERLELRKYNGLKSSYGANAKIDYKFSDQHMLYASGFLGIVEDDEFNRKTQFNWVAGVGQSMRTQNIHNILHNQLSGMEVGGAHKIGPVDVSWKVAQYENEFKYGDVPFAKGDRRNGYFVVEFEKVVRYNDYLNLDENGEITDPNNAFTRLKLLDIDSPTEDYGDPYDRLVPSYDNIVAVKPSDTMFVFNKAFTELNRHVEKDPVVARLDFAWSPRSNTKYKAGVKYRGKEGNRSLGLDGWVRNPFDPSVTVQNDFNPQYYYNGSNFLKEIDAPYQGQVPPFLTDDAIDNFIETMGDKIVHIPFGTETPYYKEFIGSSFNYTEDVVAGYAMGNWDLTDKLSVMGGLRYEDTQVKINADSVVQNIEDNTRSLKSITLNKNYRALLPMANARYNFTPNQVMRLSFTRSFRRPNFNELKPGDPEIHYSHFHVLYGNPDLKPTYSYNADLSYQHFFGAKGMGMISLYYKRVIDHIFTSFEAQDLDISSESNQFLVPGGLVSKRYKNAPYSNLAGVELTLSRKLDFISHALRNFEIMANYTYTYSRMKIEARNEMQALPRQAPNLFNARISYDSDRLQVNLGLNYRDPYLEELNLFALKDPITGEPTVIQQNTEFDLYIGKSLSLDASATFFIHKNVSVAAEINNLLNTPSVIYRGQRERPVKTEYYGLRGQVTLRYNLNSKPFNNPGHSSMDGGHNCQNH